MFIKQKNTPTWPFSSCRKCWDQGLLCMKLQHSRSTCRIAIVFFLFSFFLNWPLAFRSGVRSAREMAETRRRNACSGGQTHRPCRYHPLTLHTRLPDATAPSGHSVISFRLYINCTDLCYVQKNKSAHLQHRSHENISSPRPANRFLLLLFALLFVFKS